MPQRESDSQNTETPLLSVVLPCLNEGEGLHAMRDRLVGVLEPLTAGAYEIIFVNDGSVDDSATILDEFSAADSRIKILHLSRNFGHQAAIAAGLEATSGHGVVLMDADLQDPPEVIHRFIDRWREGFDVVYAVRRHRKERWWKTTLYAAFYRSLQRMTAIDIPLDAGDFCLLDRRVVDVMVAVPERNRFLRGLRAWVGFRQIGIPTNRAARFAGTPKYTLRRLMRLALDGYVGFSAAPLRAATWLGFSAAGAGLVLLVWVIVSRFTDPLTPRGWASTSALLLFVGGVQLIVLGVIGEYLGRVYDEVRGRPLYIVSRRVGRFGSR
jgi:glycosyltransferase involved in cell wall biosynthesis